MNYLQQVRRLFLQLTVRQRIALCVATLGVIGGLTGLRYWQKERNFKPLFQNLSGEDAGAVMTKLKESGAEIRLDQGGKTIKVPAERVDELRIQMAAVGLPKSGRIGFELFDKTNFGTSEFAEQVNYHRAVEGELERSIMSMQEVESSRVHITFPRHSLFLENRQPAKASVLLKLRPAANLSRENVNAITHLTASAVEGLVPEQVSVLDMRGNLLNRARPDDQRDEESSRQLTEYRERMERNLLQKIRATLEPLVGGDRFRAAVSLDCDLASGDQSEETFDPTRSVMMNSQRSEDGSTPAAAAGVPGTATNLPRPSARPGSGLGGPLFRRSESATFQTSRIVRHIKFPQGQIKRLSASVLLDHSTRLDGEKRIVEAPSAERVRAIKDLVSAAVGFQQDRGDQLIVEALPFEPTRNVEPAAPASPAASRPRLQLPNVLPPWLRIPLEGHLNWLVDQSWLPAAIILLVCLTLYVGYRILRVIAAGFGSLVKRPPVGKKGEHQDVPKLTPSIERAVAAPQLEARPATIGDDGMVRKPLEEQLRERARQQELLTQKAVDELDVPKAEIRRAEILSRHIFNMAGKNPESVANLIRAWIEDTGR